MMIINYNSKNKNSNIRTCSYRVKRNIQQCLCKEVVTFGVESVISSIIGKEDKCLFIVNGAYGERMVDIAKYHNINHVVIEQEYNLLPDLEKIEETVKNDNDITHIMMVHCETTTGILNDIKSVGNIAKKYSKHLWLMQ